MRAVAPAPPSDWQVFRAKVIENCAGWIPLALVACIACGLGALGFPLLQDLWTGERQKAARQHQEFRTAQLQFSKQLADGQLGCNTEIYNESLFDKRLSPFPDGFPQEEMVMLFGPKGSGKSTTVCAMARQRKNAWYILVEAQELASQPNLLEWFFARMFEGVSIPPDIKKIEVVARVLKSSTSRVNIIFDVGARATVDAAYLRDQLKLLAVDRGIAHVVLTGSDGHVFTLLNKDPRWMVYETQEMTMDQATEYIHPIVASGPVNLSHIPRIFANLNLVKRSDVSVVNILAREAEGRFIDALKVCPREHRVEYLQTMLAGFFAGELRFLCGGEFVQLANSRDIEKLQLYFHRFVQNSVFALPIGGEYRLQYNITRTLARKALNQTV